MKHLIEATSYQDPATDALDPASEGYAVEIYIPETFSEKALKVADYLADCTSLYAYKGQFILTEDDGELSTPKWAGKNLDDLNAFLEKICDEYNANPGEFPGWEDCWNSTL